ncbi:MAG: lipid-A-disaccharide synthase [Gammaproteobacteria bacterium]|nr:lipid-A-disaccharide synthase [Gammaproteobacteria bacterium]
MVLAGEASGDAHAAEFIEQLKCLQADIRFSGMGGQSMRSAGVELDYDSSNIAVVGLVEVIRHWGEIKRAMAIIRQAMEQNRPDLLILVDYPEFNLKMAAHARELGIRVLFYISPQVWAWRPKRIHKIGRLIDHMAVIFKFEAEYYRRANIPVSFVGNPLVGKVITTAGPDEIHSRLGIETGIQLVGLFPGSRNNEIRNLLPLLFETAIELKKQKPDLRFVMPVANSLDFDTIKDECLNSGIDILLTRDDIYDVISCCDAIISCSGTVTLEIALLKIPMCIIYKVSWLSYQIMSRLINIPYIGLVNIVAGRQIVQEFVQDRATVNNISKEILKILDQKQYATELKQGLCEVKSNLGDGCGSENMARLVLSFINK